MELALPLAVFNSTFYFVVGISLAVLAVLLSAYGLRDEKFPSSPTALRAVAGFVALVVAATATGAVLNARYEQKHRRAEMAEKKHEKAGEQPAEAPAQAETP